MIAEPLLKRLILRKVEHDDADRRHYGPMTGNPVAQRGGDVLIGPLHSVYFGRHEPAGDIVGFGIGSTMGVIGVLHQCHIFVRHCCPRFPVAVEARLLVAMEPLPHALPCLRRPSEKQAHRLQGNGFRKGGDRIGIVPIAESASSTGGNVPALWFERRHALFGEVGFQQPTIAGVLGAIHRVGDGVMSGCVAEGLWVGENILHIGVPEKRPA